MHHPLDIQDFDDTIVQCSFQGERNIASNSIVHDMLDTQDTKENIDSDNDDSIGEIESADTFFQDGFDIQDLLLEDEAYLRIDDKSHNLNQHDMPHNITVSAQHKRNTHFCYYCPGDQSNTQMQRHLNDCHAYEIEVLKAKNENNWQYRKLRIGLLVRKGDHLHNLGRQN